MIIYYNILHSHLNISCKSLVRNLEKTTCLELDRGHGTMIDWLYLDRAGPGGQY